MNLLISIAISFAGGFLVGALVTGSEWYAVPFGFTAVVLNLLFCWGCPREKV